MTKRKAAAGQEFVHYSPSTNPRVTSSVLRLLLEARSWRVHGEIYSSSELSCSVTKHPSPETRPMKIRGSRKWFRRGKVLLSVNMATCPPPRSGLSRSILRLNSASELLPDKSGHLPPWVPLDRRFLLRCVALLRGSLFSPFASRSLGPGDVRCFNMAHRGRVKV